jgi:hypothetical protein
VLPLDGVWSRSGELTVPAPAGLQSPSRAAPEGPATIPGMDSHQDSHRHDALLAPELRPVVDAYRTCELLTVTRAGLPIAWPTVAMPRPDGTFLITTSIALPQKAYNVRRDPRVALLFSDPTASGLQEPPQVLVQGDATCPDEIVTSPLPRADLWRRLMERQPMNRRYGATALGRRLFDWYYLRLLITVRPEAVTARPPQPAGEPLATRAEARGAGDDAFGLALRRLPGFSSAVLAAFDGTGRPTLARLRPRPDAAARRFVLDLPADADLRPGPASLLCHSHDDKLWTLRSFVVAGELAAGADGWTLAPSRHVPGGDRMGPLAAVRTIRELRATAQGYLDRRGLERPGIPWSEYAELKRS